MKADVELRVGKRERDGLPLVYTMDAKWIALDSTNEEGPTFARRCTSVSAVVDMGSSEACELILDAASPEVNPADDDGWNIQILRAWNKEGVELDPETLEPLPATSQPGLSQFPVVGSDPIWGDIIEVPTVYGEKTRVARAQLEDSSRNVLAQYTKAGKRKPGTASIAATSLSAAPNWQTLLGLRRKCVSPANGRWRATRVRQSSR